MAEGQTPTWFDSFDDETKGYLTTRGWDKLEPGAAAGEAIKAHRNAEAKLGIPSDRVLKWPENPEDKAGWDNLYGKLGVPADPKDYDFGEVKRADGTKPDEAWFDWLRGQAAELKLTKGAASDLGQRLLNQQAKEAETVASQKSASVAVEQAKLRNEWGTNYDTFKFVADRAAAVIGLTPEHLNALANGTSYAIAMETLRKLGTAMGEGRLLGIGDGTSRSPNAAMTREEALSAKSRLMADRDWVARWGRGDRAAIDEIGALDRVIVGPRLVA